MKVNPPSMIWRHDDRAASYIIEMSPDPEFDGNVIRVGDIINSFYNHNEILETGTWHWRYYVVNGEGEVSEPSVIKSFIVPDDVVQLPVPKTETLLQHLPDHPRVYVTPDTLPQFRARRHGAASEAWKDIQYAADWHVDERPSMPELKPMPQEPPTGRQHVFYLKDGEPTVPEGYSNSDLRKDAMTAKELSLAYLISEDQRYAEAARAWLTFIAPFRMDYHLENRGAHDTVVYNYEWGLRDAAVAYDRLYDLLTPEERDAIVKHIEYHCDNAYRWVHDECQLHLRYQNSHGQQCMHALTTTVMAIAGDSERADTWFDWVVPQYANRIAWGAEDGGYIEGQYYTYKYHWILDALLAIRTATGIDIFKKPRVQNSGDFWLYCNSLNYWYNHWGDIYSLTVPMYGNFYEAVVANTIAARTRNRYLKWYGRETVADPAIQPYWYLSETDLQPKPPVDIAQGQLFPKVGQLAAYDRFYDHHSNRLFFRASPFGTPSHSHCDQNGFVIHTGGEIMACDAGYYTYYGDEYHANFSRASIAHNTLLINGQGQPHNATATAEVSRFFNTADYCVFTGEAAEAYEEPLDIFDRTMVFIRPDVIICHDHLKAPEPSEYDWLFHTFEAADINQDAQQMIVHQRDQRLRVQHLAPDDISYEQSNERPYPMLTRRYCRFTDNFPQQYTIKATPPTAAETQILAVMDAYEEGEGPSIGEVRRLGNDGFSGVAFSENDRTHRVVIQGHDPGRITADGDIHTDAHVTVVEMDGLTISRWLIEGGSRLSVGEKELLRTDSMCSVAVDTDTDAAAARIRVSCEEPADLRIALLQEPDRLLISPAESFEDGREIVPEYVAGQLRLELESAGEYVIWVDPVTDMTHTPEPVVMAFSDSEGQWDAELECARAANGDTVAFATVDPREPGLFTVCAPGAEILLQDAWDPIKTSRGVDEVTGLIREQTEIFIRHAPAQNPNITATLEESHAGRIINLVRNGGFEAGIPGYPPRGWTTSHGREMAETWPGWSHEDPYQGECHLKFVRPKLRMRLRAQPMKLNKAGTYVLRFMAKGNATHAEMRIAGQRGTSAVVEIEPSEQYHEYRTELEVKPARTLLDIVFSSGGEPNQVLYVDDVEFGYIAGAGEGGQ